jgi:flagellar motility protein MotE (MotC chaperone)
MMPNFNSHIKRLLIGLLVVKVCATVAVWVDRNNILGDILTNTVTVAQAQEPAIPPEDKAENPAASGAGDSQNSIQDLHYALQSLEAKRLEIQKQDNALAVKRQQLERLKQEIETRVEELSGMQKKLEDTLAQKEAQDASEEQRRQNVEKAKINQLVKVYANMKPKSAGPIIDKLDLDVAYKIFMYMKGEQAGKILSYVNRERAAKISERLASHQGR